MWPVLRPYQDDILLASAYDKARVRLQGFGPCLYLVSRDSQELSWVRGSQLQFLQKLDSLAIEGQ